MSFKMIYDERNRNNLNQLADNTKIKAYQWYQYCIDNKIQVLVYETIRTKEKQRENVAKGASKTMNSWHLTGQAIDWVLVDSKGNALWDAYKTSNGLKVINYAKSIGFTSGHDWGWDSPHLQYDKIKYGNDTFKNKGKAPTTERNDLTVEQFNTLKALIDAQTKEIQALKAEKANRVDHTQSTIDEMKRALDWVFANKILQGNGQGLNASGTLTRQEFATMLKRYHDNVR